MHLGPHVRHLVSAVGLAWLVGFVGVPAAAQAGRVAGTVRNADGQPIRGATVTAERPESTAGSVTTVTDDRGRFALAGLQAGAWTFTASAPGFVQARGQAEVSARSNRPIDFLLRRSIAAGDLLPLDGVDSAELQGALKAADELMAAGRYDEAIAAYEAIRTRVPALTLVDLALGHAHRMKKDNERALAAYREVLKSDTGNGPARAAIAAIALEQGDAAAAEDALRPLAGNPAAGRDVLYGMGEVKRAQGISGEAAAWYRKAADLDPGWVKPVFRMAQVAFDLRELENAVALMQKVVALDPASPEAAEARVFLEQHKK